MDLHIALPNFKYTFASLPLEEERDQLKARCQKLMENLEKQLERNAKVPQTYRKELEELTFKQKLLRRILEKDSQKLKEHDKKYQEFCAFITSKGMEEGRVLSPIASPAVTKPIVSPFPLKPGLRKEWLKTKIPGNDGKIVGYISLKGQQKLFYIYGSLAVRLDVTFPYIGTGTFKVVCLPKAFEYDIDPVKKDSEKSINIIVHKPHYPHLVIATPRRVHAGFQINSALKIFTEKVLQTNKTVAELVNKEFTGVEKPPIFLADDLLITHRHTSSRKILTREGFDRFLLHLFFGLHNMFEQKFFHSDIKLANTRNHLGYFFHADADEGILTEGMNAQEIAMAISGVKNSDRPILLGSSSYITKADQRETQQRGRLSFEEIHKRKDIAAMAGTILEIHLGRRYFDLATEKGKGSDRIRYIKSCELLFTENFCAELNMAPALLDLTKSMLNSDWAKRPNGSEAYEKFKAYYLEKHGSVLI